MTSTEPESVLACSRERIRTVVRYHLRRRRDLRAFTQAESYAEICRLMERFVLGELSCWTGHDGPRDPETVEIAKALAHANRQGFLTTGSQPGEDVDGWRQRAAVDGFATGEMLTRIRRLFPADRFEVIVGHSAGTWWERNDYTNAVVTTVCDEMPVTSFGARLSRREIEFTFCGIRDEIIEQIVPMNQVTIVDRVWGPERALWDRLERL